MRIILLTQYFFPETGAPQNRLGALAEYLANKHEVHVITAMPNYPALKIFPEYEGKLAFSETKDGYQIHRVPLHVNGKGFIDRLRTYITFSINAAAYTKELFGKEPFDIVFCESPPLFLGYWAVKLAKRFKAKLVFNVSDLWPESVEKLGLVTNKLLLAPFYMLENWLYKKSDLITGQTQGICDSIRTKLQKGKNTPVHWYPNGIDLSEIHQIDVNDSLVDQFKNKKIVLYAGNLGYAQGLEVITQAAANIKDQPEVHFVIIGDGPERDKLEAQVLNNQQNNCTLLSSVSRKELFSLIKSSFAYIVPLKKIELFLGAIPSKIFEPLAFGVPVLLGVDGEAKNIFCNSYNAALYFEPENSNDLLLQLYKLLHDDNLRTKIAINGKNVIAQQFNRAVIHSQLEKKLIQINAQ
ncbi:MAG: glycosyltransferase family 4 protein [Bacteroidetes bacterium]|nr:glycosyltransferase family 4 protein [Bacteroidota bacterium]